MSQQAESPRFIDASDLLLVKPPPLFTPEQMARYTPESVFVRHAGFFDPSAALDRLHDPEIQGKHFIGIDIGGDKFVSQEYAIDNNTLSPQYNYGPYSMEARKGEEAKYLDFLEVLAESRMPVGLSIAGPVDGTRIIELPNLPILKKAMQDRYAGDFANLGINAVANDAVAVTMGSAVAAVDLSPHTRNVIVGINGGGWGGAVWKDGEIYAAEMGHTPADPMINPFDEEYAEACGVNGATFTCLEKVAASGAGIERLWERIQGEKLDGREIAKLLKYADYVALQLYDYATTGTAMGLLGFADVFDMKGDAEGTAYLLHGGAFRVPHFGQRVEQILEANLGYKPHVIYTESVSPTQNIGLDGAAIAALMAA